MFLNKNRRHFYPMLGVKNQNLQQTAHSNFLCLTCKWLNHGMKMLCTAFPSTTKEKEPCCYLIAIDVALKFLLFQEGRHFLAHLSVEALAPQWHWAAAVRSHLAKGSSQHPALLMSCSGPGKAGQGTTCYMSFQLGDYFSDSELSFPAGPARLDVCLSTKHPVTHPEEGAHSRKQTAEAPSQPQPSEGWNHPPHCIPGLLSPFTAPLALLLSREVVESPFLEVFKKTYRWGS